MNNLIKYVGSQWQYILTLLYNHIQYSLISIVIAILIGVPLGLIIFNYKKLNKPVLSLANLVQAIPSLAILGFIVPYLGIGASTAIFMVVVYSLLPILKNTYTGLSNINPETLEAAKGIGMTQTQILFRVEIPLALPVIMAGIRISSVTAVGLMTIAAYIGADVLGTLVISGIQMDNTSMILAGAIPACILALGMDFFMSKVEKSVIPTSLQLKASNLTPEKIASYRRHRKVTVATMVALFIVISTVFIRTSMVTKPDIIVGSKEAVEGRIIGHIIAETIERKTPFKVERRLGLGGTMIAYNALKTKEIDIYPDYTGTLLAAVLGYNLAPGASRDEVFSIIKTELKSRDDIHALNPYNVNNTYVLAVSKELAEQYNLKTVSDLKKISTRLKFGCSPEFAVREDGLIGFRKIYNIDFKETLNFSGTLMYTAIDSDKVQVITAFSTDSLIAKYELVTLVDDKNFFYPYHITPIATTEIIETYPEIIEALESISEYLDDATMRRLNGLAVEEGEDPEDIANDFLDEVLK